MSFDNIFKMKNIQRLIMIFLMTFILSYLVLVSNRTLSKDLKTTLSVSSDVFKANIRSKSKLSILMEERVSLVNQHCSNRSRRPNIKSGQDLYPLPEKSFIWCPVYKAASSNWMYNLLPLSGLSEPEIEKIREAYNYKHPNLVGREVAPALPYVIIKEIIQEPRSKRLLIVRHPFDRLVSAFRDKLERVGNGGLVQEMYYNLYGRNIVEKYREAATRRFGQEFFSKENNFGAPFPVEKKHQRTKDLPSWWEFVQWILDSSDHPERFDEHWRPASDFCSVCAIPYNYILHFENLEREEKYFVEELGASDSIKPRWENRNDKGIPKEDIVNKYFSLLDEKDVSRLYELYKNDFLMFGYKFKFHWLQFNNRS